MFPLGISILPADPKEQDMLWLQDAAGAARSDSRIVNSKVSLFHYTNANNTEHIRSFALVRSYGST